MKKQPNIGDRKEFVRFAFFPMIIESRFIWLRRYKIVKRYRSETEWDEFSGEYYHINYWQTVERKLMRR